MKILLIEDDIFFQKFYAFKLKEKNFDVDMANNGEEGLQKIQTNRPDVVLLDLVMPVKDGFEVLAAMQKSNLINTIPVLVFSTLGQEADIKRAMSLGARDYMNKSFFDFENLLQKINTVTAKKV